MFQEGRVYILRLTGVSFQSHNLNLAWYRQERVALKLQSRVKKYGRHLPKMNFHIIDNNINI